MANQIPIKVICDGLGNTCGLAQFTSSDNIAVAAGGTGLTTQGICEFVQPGLYAVGCQVTYLGICAGKADTGVLTRDNTYVGHSAGMAATTSSQHTIIGSQAGKAITTCSGTVAIGFNAGVAQTFGDFNTYVGTAAGAAVITASNNTIIGYHAATATISSNNIVIGTCAMAANTQGFDNVAIGLKAGATQVAAGCNNVFVGSCVGAVALCRDNTIVGAKAGIAQTSGVKNVFLGACVGYGVVGGSNNVYVGDQAGLVNTSGNANVFIGNCAGAASTASCVLIIGNGASDLVVGCFASGIIKINNAYCLPTADGSASQFLCTNGSGALAFATIPAGVTLSGSTNNTIATVTGANALIGEANLTFDGTLLAAAAGSQLVVGNTAAITTDRTAGTQILGSDNDNTALLIGRFDNSTVGGKLAFVKSRNATIGGNTIVQSGDQIGGVVFNVSDGGDLVSNAVQILAKVDGTPGVNDTPGRLEFWTTPDGSYTATERMRIDNAGNASMGGTVNTYSPSFGAANDVFFDIGGAGGGNVEFTRGADVNATWIGGLHWANTNNSSTSNDAGAIGIAHILGEIVTTDGNAGDDSGGSIVFYTKPEAAAAAEVVRIDSAGRVGIGNATPSTYGAINSVSHSIVIGDTSSGNGNLTIANSTTGNGRIAFTDTADTTNQAYIRYNHSDNVMDFYVNGAERMRISDAGTLAVGKTAIEIAGAGSMLLGNGQAYHTVDGNPVLYVRRDTSAGTAVNLYNTTTLSGTIGVNGASASFNTSSDYRLKENVVDLTNATTRVAQLQPRRFNFIADAEKTMDGFIAHEVSDIVPQAITGTKDETRDVENVIVNAAGAILVEDKTEAEWVAGKERALVSEATEVEAAVYADPIYAADTVWHATLTVPEYQGIDQAKLVPLLTAAIQELTARITALESA